MGGRAVACCAIASIIWATIKRRRVRRRKTLGPNARLRIATMLVDRRDYVKVKRRVAEIEGSRRKNACPYYTSRALQVMVADYVVNSRGARKASKEEDFALRMAEGNGMLASEAGTTTVLLTASNSCSHENCEKAVQSRGFCKAHGA